VRADRSVRPFVERQEIAGEAGGVPGPGRAAPGCSLICVTAHRAGTGFDVVAPTQRWNNQRMEPVVHRTAFPITLASNA